MDLSNIDSVYFVGAGGIGMSALVRYFLKHNKNVGGYDKVSTPLTATLIKEGAQIHYEDNVDLIPEAFKSLDPAKKSRILIIYTPAIPSTHTELTYFKENGFEIQKRAQVLGTITKSLHSKGLCVAGTHGKTTTSTMIAHIFDESHLGCNAFVGGISKNNGTNFIANPSSHFTVIEADEFDRSFHWLKPYMTVITAVDADHLDIYGDLPTYTESFEHYSSLVDPEGGVLIMKKGLKMTPRCPDTVKIYNYSLNDADSDFHAENIRQIPIEKVSSEKVEDDQNDLKKPIIHMPKGIIFDWVGPDCKITDIQLGVPVPINVENAVAAIAIAHLNGVTDDEIRHSILSFKGVDRRFDFKIVTDKVVYLSDYGHHPVEVRESIKSVREMFIDNDGSFSKLTVAFQPHLYSRTNDFYKEFAESLSLADELILLDIYPARELPIEGVTSKLIFDNVEPDVKKEMCKKEDLVELIKSKDIQVLITLGAGDIDNLAPQITEVLRKKYNV